ncbi:MAG: DNA repair protein RadC [Planctomycetota bacterium]|jgi:DNA repair protein RadC
MCIRIANTERLTNGWGHPEAKLGQGLEAEVLQALTCLVGSRAGRRLVRAGLDSVQELRALVRRSPEELACHAELGLRAAERLCSAAALGRALQRSQPGPALRRPGQVAELLHGLLAARLEGLEQEEFHAVLLDARHRPISVRQVSVGTLTASLVHPREVYRAAVRLNAAALVVAHNHPSGDPEPSLEDLELTRRLVSSGELLGIPLLDHVIVGEGVWVSLRERGII